jgi:hypothetical protein
MEGTASTARRIARRARKDAVTHWQGAAVITALAVGDVAYRLLVRAQVRRALGMEIRRA